MCQQVPDKCTIATYAIRSALLSWGFAWIKLDVETRQAYLMLAIVKCLSGNAWSDQVGRQDAVPWTAKDCWDILDICKHWSTNGEYGANLARMVPDDKRLSAMFTDPYGYPYK